MARLHATTPEELWSADLDAFVEHWRDIVAEDERRATVMVKQQAQARKAGAKAAKGKGKKKANAWSDDEEDGADAESGAGSRHAGV